RLHGCRYVRSVAALQNDAPWAAKNAPAFPLVRSWHYPAGCGGAASSRETEAFERSRRDRKRAEMLFAHLKRILRLARLRLRGPWGARFEFILAAIAQNLRRLAKLTARPPPTADACLA